MTAVCPLQQDQASSHSEGLWGKFPSEETAPAPQQLSWGHITISGHTVKQEKERSWPGTPIGIFLHYHGWIPWVVGYIPATHGVENENFSGGGKFA